MRDLTVVEFYKLGFSFRPHGDSSQLIDLCFPDSEKKITVVVTLIPTARFEEVLQLVTAIVKDWGEQFDTWKEVCRKLGLS